MRSRIGLDLTRPIARKLTATIYLVEEHKYFLREVKETDPLTVQLSVLGVSEKLFHLHCVMQSDGHDVAISELMEMHVCQTPIAQGCAHSTGYCSAFK